MKKNKGWFEKGNKAAKKPDHRCFLCGDELTKRQIAIKAKFCHVNCRVTWHKKIKKYNDLSVTQTEL